MSSAQIFFSLVLPAWSGGGAHTLRRQDALLPEAGPRGAELMTLGGGKIYTQPEYSALQIFGGLVLGCIKMKFCKKICV